MIPNLLHRRAGMTLIELLVVVAIIGLLAVTVLPNVASTTESRRSREAARVTSSFFAKAQSRAIGRPEWAGFAIVPPNATSVFALDLFQANVPQIYRGESNTASLTLSGSAWKRAITYSADVTLPILTTRSVATGDLIRFDGRGPWYELTDNGLGVQFRGTMGGSVGATELSSQSERNTPWPTMGTQSPHSYEILRLPVRNGTAFTIPDSRCVDLFWSGYGSAATFTGNRFTVPGTSVSLLFDATGRVRQIVTQNAAAANRVTVTGPVYFLVGRVDRAGQAFAPLDPNNDSVGANWQYGDSYWIVIDPASGLVETAECLPGQTDVVASQQFARSETPAGGR